ncbi:MAG: tRNA uridine-5-carboxymethylaminomethyl(34) synthesis GTPase MnmE [Clostridiales bacterium]|nr:tRNA uridine-5-carboxymethylaminomethyl(34) synthesis GTPase MnmE [Clostridiales bacterium]
MMEPFCALSTPVGVSGIAVIRASGEGVSEKVSKAVRILRTAGGRSGVPLSSLKGYESAYCRITDPKSGKTIDDVVITVYEAPHSYTGEDMIEISCHGGSAVRQEILRVLNDLGIRQAAPGEFTKTAFINGKMDLTEAEAVMNVISADSKRALDASNSQLMGQLRGKILQAEDILYKALSSIEMMLEFPEHDDTPENLEAVTDLIKSAEESYGSLARSFERGRLLTERMKVAIVGLPNSGKSTLLNFLAGYTRAIVTDIPGTTRDTLEFNTEVEGIPVTFIDTAGLRETEDEIEAMGVKLAGQAASEADLVLYLIAPDTTYEDVLGTISGLDPSKVCVLFSKSDKGDNPSREKIESILRKKGVRGFAALSVKEDRGTEYINEFVRDYYESAGGLNSGDITVLSARHASLLDSVTVKLFQALSIINEGLGVDVCSQVIRAALEDSGQITGRTVSEELTETIFARFCIGK